MHYPESDLLHKYKNGQAMFAGPEDEMVDKANMYDELLREYNCRLREFEALHRAWMERGEKYDELLKSHIALLTTLGASKSKWIQWVVRNSKARLEKITGESFESHFKKFN
jgi:hypothetical protein